MDRGGQSHIVNVAATTKRKLLKCKPRGFDDRGSVVIDVWPFRGVGLRSQWTRFCGWEGKMLRNKANGPADCMVTEKLQWFLTETMYEVAHWFDKRFPMSMSGPRCVDNFTIGVFQEARCQAREGPTAVLSVFSQWYSTVLVGLRHEEKESVEWRRLHVGAERGMNCEHMQALV